MLHGIVAADAAAARHAPTSAGRRRQASLALADAELEPFQAMRLVAPLKKSLAQKKASMEHLLADYGHAAEYGITDVTTAATYRIAELYAELAHALNESERPAELSSDELDQYEMLLEEQAFPFEERQWKSTRPTRGARRKACTTTGCRRASRASRSGAGSLRQERAQRSLREHIGVSEGSRS